jgi:hypothetical protein
MVGKPLRQVGAGYHANVIVLVVLDLKERGKPKRYEGLVNAVLTETDHTRKIAAFTWTTK